MGLNETPSGERIHVGFFGVRNAGKSSLVNAVTGQQVSIVSNVKGTTTDAVKKTMELLPLGPVVIIDTPGIDDCGFLGEKRVEAAERVLRRCDIAVLVTVAGEKRSDAEKDLIALFGKMNIPFTIAANKSDLLLTAPIDESNTVYVSAYKKKGIEALKNKLGSLAGSRFEKKLAADLVSPGDFAVLVTPIDSAAPKGRLILPQQQVIRDVLDSGAVSIVLRETELEAALAQLGKKPSIVITDSQVFGKVSKIVPPDIPLTSFSILMARYKGFLDTALKGASVISLLKNGDKVLISEGCTHHRQCEDIGTVKLPRWLEKFTCAKLQYEWSSGGEFQKDLSRYKLIIHCGGCMLNQKELEYRMNCAAEQGVPFTNYGTAIAYMNGILERCIAPLPGFEI